MEIRYFKKNYGGGLYKIREQPRAEIKKIRTKHGRRKGNQSEAISLPVMSTTLQFALAKQISL